MIVAVGAGAESRAMVGNTGSICTEAEREYLRAEYIVVHRESSYSAWNSHTFACQAIQAVPPTPIRRQKGELGGTPWDPQWDEMIGKALPPEMFSRRSPGVVDSARDFTSGRN